MKLPRPMVILFGAGATRAAFQNRRPPPPTDADFFEIAGQVIGRGTKRLAKRVKNDVFELYGRVTGIGLEQYYRDIETRSELGEFAKSANRPKNWRVRTKDLEELVRRVLIQTTCEMKQSPARVSESPLHKKILEYVEPGDTLITFNYDTVIEESMPLKNSSWTPRGGYGVDVSGFTHEWTKNWLTKHSQDGKARKTKIRLLKLHGSLNWVLYRTSKVRLKPRPYIVRARNGNPVFDKAAFLPPGWHKRVDRNPYNSLWREARRALENCSTLVIVGYSLPDTDLIARALFLEATRSRRARNRYIKQLHIADVSELSKSRIVEQFIQALGSEGVVFKYGDAKELVDDWKRD